MRVGASESFGFTGHRPERLGGYNEENPTAYWVKEQLSWLVTRLVDVSGFRWFITGGALGTDTWAAETVLRLRAERDLRQTIGLHIYTPFPNYDNRWTPLQRERYLSILRQAAAGLGGPHMASSQKPASRGEVIEALHFRNRCIVDASRALCAVWDGVEKGGTWHAITVGRARGRPIYVINPVTRFAGWEIQHG